MNLKIKRKSKKKKRKKRKEIRRLSFTLAQKYAANLRPL
jgi:hypothetical protein